MPGAPSPSGSATSASPPPSSTATSPTISAPRAVARDCPRCSMRRWSCSATAGLWSIATGRSKPRTAFPKSAMERLFQPTRGCRTGAEATLRRDPHALPPGDRRTAGPAQERGKADRSCLRPQLHAALIGGTRPAMAGRAPVQPRPQFRRALHGRLRRRQPGISVAHNEPYVVDDLSDYTIPVHGEARGIPHLLLEIRNDQIAEPDGQRSWAELVSDALAGRRRHDDEKGNFDGHADFPTTRDIPLDPKDFGASLHRRAEFLPPSATAASSRTFRTRTSRTNTAIISSG